MEQGARVKEKQSELLEYDKSHTDAILGSLGGFLGLLAIILGVYSYVKMRKAKKQQDLLKPFENENSITKEPVLKVDYPEKQ